MAPKSKLSSAKSASSSAKPASHSAKPASSASKKIKQELLKSCKPGVSLHMKENRKKLISMKDRKSAASFSAKENHKKVKPGLLKVGKPAENDVLRKTLAVKNRVTTIIPRPEKGAAGSGFNLQEVMGLADDAETYALLRRSVRDLAAKAGLDCAVLWHRQPKDIISKIIGAARERHNYFNKFPHGWAIEEFLKSNLKNKRAYARRRGYLGDRTNQGVEKSKLGDSDGDDSEGASDIDEGASNIDGGTSNIDEGTSNIDEGTSNIDEGASDAKFTVTNKGAGSNQGDNGASDDSDRGDNDDQDGDESDDDSLEYTGDSDENDNGMEYEDV